jgi:hypothetical protein
MAIPRADFAFHELAFLARIDPVAFERRRCETLAQFIATSDTKAPLGIALQREIDRTRSKESSPEAALEAIAALMCHKLCYLGAAMRGIKDDIQRVSSLAHMAPQ